ncbi:hypothetical protein ACTNA3_09335, partial [Collinsella sp. HCP28S3_E5]|uniref:hypothetical protein n=1 Tax=Collinsella sp. HCP28S3_E5 TaxID=3438922 RepID=UPI003F8C0C89
VFYEARAAQLCADSVLVSSRRGIDADEPAAAARLEAMLTSMYFCPIAPIIFAPSRQLTMSSRTNANCPILAILLSSSFPSARP